MLPIQVVVALRKEEIAWNSWIVTSAELGKKKKKKEEEEKKGIPTLAESSPLRVTVSKELPHKVPAASPP